VRSGRHDQPYAIRTQLGWAVRGPVTDTTTQKAANVNFQQSADVLLQQQLEKMWTTDFADKVKVGRNLMSLEDKKTLKSMDSSLKYENGHYKLRLPWRDDKAIMPNNLTLAHARLDNLKKKLARDHDLHKMYNATITDCIQKGHAKEDANIETDNKDQWRYVDTSSNPADVDSRGKYANDFETITFWMYGPEFLQKDESHWPSQQIQLQVDEDDNQVKKEVAVNTTVSAMESLQLTMLPDDKLST
jgi:hypothetical protein